MVKYLIKKKMKKEVEENSKKALVYTGVALTGIGVYFSYRAIKNYKKNKDLEEQEYLEDSEYEIYNYEKEKNEEESELKDKIEEFNSNRLSCDTCPHVSKEELESYVKESEEYKESNQKLDIDQNEYKEEKYDKYEYYEDDLSKEK